MLLKHLYTRAPGHEYKLLNSLRVNAPWLLNNWFWWVGSIACRFYWVEASPKGYSLKSSVFCGKKELVEFCLLLNHLSSLVEKVWLFHQQYKGTLCLLFWCQSFLSFPFTFKSLVYISIKFWRQSRIRECLSLCACLFVLSLPIYILVLYIK